MQSPAFWFNQQIYSIAEKASTEVSQLYLSTGTIDDNLNDARQMKNLLEKKSLSYTYIEVNEGHSWGAWSAQLVDILIQFYGK